MSDEPRLLAAFYERDQLREENDKLKQQLAEANAQIEIERQAKAALQVDNLKNISISKRRIEALIDAAQSLLDEQNGPPLIRREKQWYAAVNTMRNAIK